MGGRDRARLFFLLPLVAMLEFTTRARLGQRPHPRLWRTLADVRGARRRTTRTCVDGRRRLGRAGRPHRRAHARAARAHDDLGAAAAAAAAPAVEFVCLLPLTVPAIVLVVGLAPVYAWVAYFLGPSSSDAVLRLHRPRAPVRLPGAGRGAAAIDVRTLVRGGPQPRRRLVHRDAPGSCCRTCARAVLSASFLSVALVLGEFTVANLLSRTNVQVAINLLGKRDPSISVAVSLAALVLAFALLLVLSLAGVRRRRRGPRAGAAGQPVLAVTPVPLEETP